MTMLLFVYPEFWGVIFRLLNVRDDLESSFTNMGPYFDGQKHILNTRSSKKLKFSNLEKIPKLLSKRSFPPTLH